MIPTNPIVNIDRPIQMVDLHSQYLRIQPEVDAAMQAVLANAAFINGPEVKSFAVALGHYLGGTHVIPCGNGTDALQLALMALDIQPGDEIVVPAFTYVAAAEVVALLGAIPVLVDVCPDTYNLDVTQIEAALSARTRAIIAVHLFGQTCDMAPLLAIAERYGLFVVEDNAQSIGAYYTFPDGTSRAAGTIGHIGTTSFFPSKPLACYGDGGAVLTRDPELADRIRCIANHGQSVKYKHIRVGCNSRLDTLQATVLQVKLKHLDDFTHSRQVVARRYDEAFSEVSELKIPVRSPFSTHVFHQYTLRVSLDVREELQRYLKKAGIPSMIYYPLPLHWQPAYKDLCRCPLPLPVSEALCKEVLSLPIHTELDKQQPHIINTILSWINRSDLR